MFTKSISAFSKKKDFKIMAKKAYIRTFGCQMNKHDSEAVLGLLMNHGYELTENRGNADVFLVNTCSVRKHAEDKVYSMLGELRKLKKKNKRDSVVGVIG